MNKRKRKKKKEKERERKAMVITFNNLIMFNNCVKKFKQYNQKHKIKQGVNFINILRASF
jgi:hypothetical protein